MKKLLLSTLLLGSAFVATSQVLLTENFNSYTTGNFATEVMKKDSFVMAQGAWGVGSNATNPSQSSFQIVNGSLGNNKLNISGSSDTTFYMAQKTVDFTTRTVNNDYIKVDFKFNTGVASNSKNNFGVFLTSSLGDVVMGMNYLPTRKAMYGKLYTKVGNNEGTFTVGLVEGDTAPVILKNNTDYQCTFIYDFLAGEAYWTVKEGQTIIVNNLSTNATVLFYDYSVSGLSILSSGGNGNTASHTISIDDINIQALLTLGLDKVKERSSNNISVFPNPATDLVTVKFNDLSKVNDEIRLTSMDGKVIETRKVSNLTEKFDVSTLKGGIYFFQIGDVTEKVMVK